MYGIRPEHCALVGNGGLPADVVVVEPTGADTQLYCRFNGQEVNAMVRDRVDCRPGDRIALTPDLGQGASIRRGERRSARGMKLSNRAITTFPPTYHGGNDERYQAS